VFEPIARFGTVSDNGCMYPLLISAQQLQQLLVSGVPHMVFDCSFDLANPALGRQQFEDRHIPGAVHIHLDDHLSDKTGADRASGGRHPLPSRETFAARMGDLGFRPDMQAVVYDRQGANYCGRLWWMLKWCGHEAVAVLDGGVAAWEQAGGALEQGMPQPTRTDKPTPGFSPGPCLAATASAQEILQHLGKPAQTLIDARATPRFLGEVEPLDPVAGHVPGALNRPFSSNLGVDGRFKPAGQLREEFEALLAGRDPASVVHHCGSGVSAIPNLLAMELAGLGRSRLFPGSWSEWCNSPGLPVARG
jgi:thiosulfate/3-mercaptopyruvate sulfurtransferase